MRIIFLLLLLFVSKADAATFNVYSNGDNCLVVTTPTVNNSNGLNCGNQGDTTDNTGYAINFPVGNIVGFTSATINIWESGRASNHNVTISRILQPWIFSTSTWNVYSTGNNWVSAGCLDSTSDFTTTNQVTVGNQNGGLVTATVTSLINDLISNGSRGLIIRGIASFGDAYNTRRGTKPPYLRVVASGIITDNKINNSKLNKAKIN